MPKDTRLGRNEARIQTRVPLIICRILQHYNIHQNGQIYGHFGLLSLIIQVLDMYVIVQMYSLHQEISIAYVNQMAESDTTENL